MEFENIGMSDAVDGSSVVGYINCDYAKLVKVFGEQSDNDGFKVDAEWCLKFADGTIATIYNWKDGKNYQGPDGLDIEYITHWHVGGFDGLAVQRVKEAIYG